MVDLQQLPYRRCVGIMLVNRDNLVWVGRRADRPDEPEGRGTWWQMPQGGIDEGEDPSVAVRRELREETGIRSVRLLGEASKWHAYDLPAHLIGVAWQGRYRGQKQLWFAARFEGQDSEVDLGGHAGQKPEFDAWRWVSLDELPAIVVPFKRQVYEEVIGELAPLIGEPS
jgi:putative (di)nucleoside polyphosphate hydrolase